MMALVQSVGRSTLATLLALGHAVFFFVDLVRFLPAATRRFSLVVAQIHAIGNRSLVIILASGLAVGFVLALQMYYALLPYGAAESLGLVVNLSLVRELGPVVTALLFAGRAGTSLTAEIGLMKAGEQLTAMELIQATGISLPTNAQCKEVGHFLRDVFGPPKRIRGRDRWKVCDSFKVEGETEPDDIY